MPHPIPFWATTSKYQGLALAMVPWGKRRADARWWRFFWVLFFRLWRWWRTQFLVFSFQTSWWSLFFFDKSLSQRFLLWIFQSRLRPSEEIAMEIASYNMDIFCDVSNVGFLSHAAFPMDGSATGLIHGIWWGESMDQHPKIMASPKMWIIPIMFRRNVSQISSLNIMSNMSNPEVSYDLFASNLFVGS